MKPTSVVSNSTFIEQGLTEIFGQELTAFHPGLEESQMNLLTLRESAARQLGQLEARGMFIRAGRASFNYWMRQYSDVLGWREMDFRLLPVPTRINRALSDTLKWFESENFFKGALLTTNDFWQISVTGLEAQAAYLDCNFFIGMIQELVCWAGGGKYFPAREMQCQAEGSDRCLFEIAKQPAG